MIVLSYDALLSFFRDGELGIGVGTIILVINPILLAGYTFGCHAFRHMVGGRMDCFTCPNGKEKLGFIAWKGVSHLNGQHMLWAWVSMIWVVIADVYVRLVSMGLLTDLNTWGN